MDMGTGAKRKNLEHPEHLENSELEVMRAKIRKLEVTVRAKTEDEELRMIKNDQVDHHETQENDVRVFKLTPESGVDHGYDEAGVREAALALVEEETRRFEFEIPLMKTELERVVSRLLMGNLSMKRNLNEVVDFLSVFMNNHGLKRITDKILSYLDCGSFFRCRIVCRLWKNFIDNEFEWSMLQLKNMKALSKLCEVKALETKQKKAEIDRKVFEAEERRKQEEAAEKKKKDEEKKRREEPEVKRHELPPEPLKDKENYDIKDLRSDDDTDDEENPRKIIPKWAHGSQFRVALMHQAYSPPDVDMIFIALDANPNLEEIFKTQKRRFHKRTSSAVWGKAPFTNKW